MIAYYLWTFSLIILIINNIIPSEANIRNPLKDPYICGRPECEENNKKFDFHRNIRYKYDYRMHVKTEFSGSGENSSDVFVSASVILTFPKSCEGVLQIQEIELREKPLVEVTTTDNEDSDNVFDAYDDYAVPEIIDVHPRSEDFANNIQRNDLRFAFHDGIIGEACSAEDEDIWVLNFKKGILSALQNSMKRFDIDFNTTETDISGTCDVVYTLDGGSGTSLLIIKTKNIISCTNRYKTNSVLQTTPYDFRKNYAVWPILQSDSYCKISVDHNVYQDVMCYERHQLVPFSNNQSGAVTESKISLTLVDEELYELPAYEDQAEIEKRSTLLFNHYPSPKPIHGEIKAARDLLKEMCRLGFPDIQRDFIDVFTKFLQTARVLSYTALYQLLSRASSICSNGKNHVMESLPYIGSTPSVELMKDQIIKNQVPIDVAHKWLSLLSFIPRPDEEMLQSFYNLIDYGNKHNDHLFILTSTAVAHTYCRHNVECDKIKEIKKIVRYLEDNISQALENNVNDRVIREKIVVLLKGLGNIGVITKSFEKKLKLFIENETLPMDIRLQTIFSHRRLDCQQSKEYFLNLYRNFQINSEIRIASYLQMMRCPDYVTIKNIKYVLEEEEVNQVGSYVWSHLNNLAKSASPVRVAAQGLLVDGDLGTKYKLDIRKFSRNFEHSLFFDEYNFGGFSDANLIFGTESYMPRALSFNLTADLFGESVNFFEGSARMQGFEELVQTYFGPKGPLTLAIKEKIKNASGIFSWLSWLVRDSVNSTPEDEDYMDRYNHRLKRKSESSSEENMSSEEDEVFTTNGTEHKINKRASNLQYELSNNVKSLKYNLNYDFNKPRLAYGFKVFGNDLKYGTIEGINEIFQTLNQLDPMTHIKNLFSGQEITYTKSGVFLDASYEVPLIVGLPLAIHAFGASSVDLRMSGSLGAGNFMQTHQLDIEGKLKPSVSVDVIGTMQSDYFYGVSGVRVYSNLYSSSSIEAKLKVRGTRLISLQFSLPQDRNDIFSARSKLIVITRDGDLIQKGIDKRYTNSTCTWPMIDKAVGLKLCADYSLPDVSNSTKMTTYPSLLFSGPIDINIELSKADLTAKTYLFEYRWDDAVANTSSGSMIFETPGSVIPRKFSANMTSDLETYNASMIFQNGDQFHSAVAKYKNTPNDKRFEIYFELEGQKNLALEMSLNRTEIKYGWVYYPRFLITVNDERIAGLAGTLKATNKKGIYQYDINLTFETKRLQTHISGYVTLTDVSFTPKLKIDYLFLDNKRETVEIDGELANRSSLKTRTEYNGALTVKATAYPQFNFASKFKFLSLLGHVECKLDVNNAPDLIDPNYTLTIRLIFARFHLNEFKNEGSRTTASIDVTRPKSNTDFKLMLKHEEKFKTGPEHNVLFVLRFAPKKEATAIISVHLPRGPLFAIDAVLNITVPAFDSCAMALRLVEKKKNDYNIDFQGTWFSGHSIIIKGVYQDKSNVVKTYYHLKLMAKSPHFDETTIDLRYWRDETELTFDLQVFYAKQPFALLIKHSEQTEFEKILYTELKLREKLYSLSANMRSQNPKQLFVELHIDKLRDVHLILRGLSTDHKKEAGIEIKWDANRDPTQKLAIAADFNIPNYKTYDGSFLIAYPERTFSATFDLYAGGPDYRGNARLGWSSYESIDLNFIGWNRIGKAKDLYFNVKFNTPFDGWKHNAINGGLYHSDNLLLVNSSAVWAENQNLAAAFMGDYSILDPEFTCEIKLGINSTIKDVPSISAHLKHTHDLKKLDSDLNVRHTPLGEQTNVFSIKSIWQFDVNVKYRNVTGSIALRSPFAGYRTGAMSTKFSLSDKKQLRGAADLDIEEKKFTLSVEGHVKKFTDNMLVTNITTPIEKFRNIVGRFGISEKDRHIVAEVRGPHSALGIELLFAIVSVSNFDVKFNLETPLEAFEKIMIIGKMKPETVDFRGAWNKIVLGYVGVSRLAAFNDFEYSYKVYTPIEHFTENGFVAKLVQKDDFDLEITLKFAQYKLGIVVNAKPKPKLIRQLGLKRTHELLNNLLDDDDIFKNHGNGYEDEDNDDDNYDLNNDYDDEDELLNFIGNMELYTLLWPTIIGALDVDEIDDTYLAFGTLILPQGTVELRDQFFYPDYFNMKNTLKIMTPFSCSKEIRSIYEHSIDLGNYYTFGLDISILNVTNWLDTGFNFNYTTTTDEAELKTYDVLLNIKTPIKLLPKIGLKGNIELEDSIYRGNFSATTIDTHVSIGGSLESDENYVDALIGLELSAPAIPKYVCKAYFKKDFSDIENTIDLGFEIHDNNIFNKFQIDTMWHTDRPHYLNAKGKLRTNIIPIEIMELSVLLTKTPNLLASLEFAYALENSTTLTEFRAKMSRKKEHVHCELITPIQDFGNISLQGSLSSIPGADNVGLYNLMGNLYKNTEIYNIDGNVTLQYDIPIEINLKLKSLQYDNRVGSLMYSIKEVEGGAGKIFKFNATESDKFIQIVGGYSVLNPINWKLIIAIVTSDNILSNETELHSNRINLNATISPNVDGITLGKFKLNTPWSHLGIESVELLSEMDIRTNAGKINNSYALSPDIVGNNYCEWSWIIMEKMLFIWESNVSQPNLPERILKTGIQYENPNRNMKELNIGANLNVNSLWNFQSKSSLTFLSKSDIGISLNVQLPEPIGDFHRLSGRYRGNFNSNNSNMDINYEIKYQADEARTLLASRGQYINTTDMQSLLRFEWGHDIRNDAVEANVHMLRKNIRREFAGRLATPYYIEDTLTTSGSYDLRDIYQLFNCKINYPATRQIATGDIAYSSLSNMKGFLNSTTPFTNLTWLRGDFDFTTSGSQSIRYIKTTWPKDTATFDLKSTYSFKNLERDLQGIIKIEAPLTSRHYVNIDYSLKERESITTGHTNVEYNKKQVLKGEYICKSEVRAGYTKDAVDITLENDFKPIGIIYVHVTENSGIDSPHYNMKHAELYELRNSRLVNITGEVHVRTTMTGQDYKIIAIHPNRTVVFTSDYDFQDQTTKHKSRLELAPAVWFAYYLKLQNYTTLHNESQSYTLDFSYPRRNISTDGWYAVTENAFNSDISFQWTRNQNSDDNNDYNSYGYDDNSETDKNEPRVMRAALQWRNEPLFDDDKDNQTTVLTIRHPSFLKDVTFSGSYYKSSIDLYKTKLIVNYCDAPEHLLTLESSMRDLSSIVGYRNYSLVILAHHEISELDLNVHGSIGARPGLYETINIAKYKRGYLPLQDGFLIGLLDIQAKEISYFKQTPYKTVRLWSRAGGSFPIYTINSTLEDSPDLNSTGKFYLNIDNKYIRLNINMTPDASQNVHMLGEIPDARSASFDLWRDYEDIRVVDISYYLRMNHSRLVTSQLIWRPKMKTEIKEKLRGIATSFYESLSENIDFWVKTLYTEAMDTANDIWRNAKPHTQRFLDDVGGLRVLEDDIEEFRLFLNQSYEANDFYVKTVVNFTLTIIDELAIRNHIGSVPKILSEVWTVLGDSGQALRRSILWLIDTIKTSYKKTLEIISKILHGESLEHLSGIIERVVEKYDKFIKDLHLKLIKHVEHLWATMTDMISNYWKRSLHRIEPSIIKFLHYIETMIWNISKEIFDFLYKRTNELIESPYFNKVSDFTQDLDRLYKDLMANDALTNIKKYTVLGWEFLKEKYFKIVPFGKEMHDVMTELLEEIKTLKNLEIIKLINSKINEVQTKLIWIGNNLQLDQRIQQLWSMFRNKMTRIAQTALQADDKYREAKTKFIFDPDIGCIELEQKLPMSWHSFNETPKFEEIPEYKLLIDIQEFFNGNNFSLWNLYYEYKPYMDPNNWLPPFKSYSLLIGSRHFLTFDKKFVSLNFKYSLIDSNRKPEQCSYLLAHDFFDSNFTLVLEPSIIKHNNNLISTKKLALLTENEIVDIDIVGSSIRIGRNLTSTLPIQIGDTVIYRDADMLLIESDKGFNLHCNLQFDFCWFELSGWYFGKTAGLFGTMNNEHFDEFTTSTNEIMDFDVINNYNYMNITNGEINTNENVNSNNNVNDFINSWALPGCKLNSNNANNNSISITPSLEIINLCDSLFKSKLSYFVNCFTIIDPKPFYKMCLDLGTNSISNFIDAKHPAHKGACTIALGYIEACAVEKTPLRIPDTCVHCDLVNGSYVPEGTFITLEGNDIPMTTDVVFIIEAKPCNRNVTINKNLNSLVSALNKELTDINIKNNRYAVVTFGGAPPFDKPRSVVYNNKIFTDHINLRYYFDHILTDNGNFSDIFEAISTATKLIFRPGASKTFILLPCSGCNSSYMRLDFSTMLQVLLEENINLHILMDQPFELDKKRIERIFFGMDREHAYTKKYLKDLKGDSDLHRQITSSLPKKHLGICTPLAFETNGTIFTSKKIRPGSRNPIKKFTSVFAKRIAQTATPNSCQTCECTGHNTGIAYMTCTSCELPNAWNLDYDFNENDMLSVMQAGTDFNWGDDYE